jgi:hypothetical protein
MYIVQKIVSKEFPTLPSRHDGNASLPSEFCREFRPHRGDNQSEVKSTPKRNMKKHETMQQEFDLWFDNCYFLQLLTRKMPLFSLYLNSNRVQSLKLE